MTILPADPTDPKNKFSTIAEASWRWQGLHAKRVDGFAFTMPDTPANQEKLPQLTSQAPGVGDVAGVYSDPQGHRDGRRRSRQAAASAGLRVGLSDGPVLLDVVVDRLVPRRAWIVPNGVGADCRH